MEPVLGIVTYLLGKHFLADFCLQASYQVRNKGRYGHIGGIIHSGIHALLTVPLLFFLLGDAYRSMAVIAAAEFVIHYHIDYFKEGITRRAAVGPEDHLFWVLLGFDQLAHHLTYIAMTALLLTHYARYFG
jgi:hypothetical protein